MVFFHVPYLYHLFRPPFALPHPHPPNNYSVSLLLFFRPHALPNQHLLPSSPPLPQHSSGCKLTPAGRSFLAYELCRTLVPRMSLPAGGGGEEGRGRGGTQELIKGRHRLGCLRVKCWVLCFLIYFSFPVSFCSDNDSMCLFYDMCMFVYLPFCLFAYLFIY